MKMKFLVGLILVAIVVISCKQSNAQEAKTIEIISVADMEEALKADDVQLIDVRSKGDYASGHIKDAKNIVYQGENWDKQVASLDKDKPVYVYCAKGGRSARCASLLEEAGFTKIFDLDGGVTKWINEGKAVQ